MRGHIHKRSRVTKSGKTSTLYYAIVDVPSGSRKQDWGRGFRTRREAEAELNRKVSAVTGNHFVNRTRLTLGDYLVDQWLPAMIRAVKPSTHGGYVQVARDYLIPHLGGVCLQDLNVTHINRLYRTLLESGGKGQRRTGLGLPVDRVGRPLSPKTVANAHLVLSKALNDAVDTGLIQTNPTTKAKKVRVRASDREVTAWTEQELADYLAATVEERLHAVWHLGAYTGMRRGELLGLRWQDLDPKAATLSVRQTIVLAAGTPTFGTPKNHEARVIDLDPDTVSVLCAHRSRQKQEREAWGPGYSDTGLVFTKEDGSFIHPDRISQIFDRSVRLSGLRRITLHCLRHTHATILLKHGVPLKVVSERLGHSDPAFTMRIYQHVVKGMQSSAAALFASVISASASAPAFDERSGALNVRRRLTAVPGSGPSQPETAGRVIGEHRRMTDVPTEDLHGSVARLGGDRPLGRPVRGGGGDEARPEGVGTEKVAVQPSAFGRPLDDHRHGPLGQSGLADVSVAIDGSEDRVGRDLGLNQPPSEGPHRARLRV